MRFSSFVAGSGSGQREEPPSASAWESLLDCLRQNRERLLDAGPDWKWVESSLMKSEQIAESLGTAALEDGTEVTINWERWVFRGGGLKPTRK